MRTPQTAMPDAEPSARAAGLTQVNLQRPRARVPEAPPPDLDAVLGGSETGRPRRWLWRTAVGVAILAGAAAAFRWAYPTSQAAPTYQTEAARRGSLTVYVTATGNLEPMNQVEIGSELSGQIETVSVDFNDHVVTGQVLAKLDTDRLEAQVARDEAALALAEAGVREADASAHEAEMTLSRSRDLAGRSLISPQDLEAAEAAQERAAAAQAKASAQVLEAQAALDSDRENLSKAVIRSPIDGIVLERRVEPGQTVAASLQAPVLFTIAESLDTMELQVDVDEADIGSVRQGQEATFMVDAYPGRRFTARIAEVHFAPETVGGVVTYKAILEVDNPDGLLRPGMTATADIIAQRVQDQLLIPNAALRFTPASTEATAGPRRGGLLGFIFRRPGRPGERTRQATPSQAEGEHRVWTLENGRAVPVPVVTGVTDGRWTVATAGGVTDGMPLVTDVAAKGAQ